MHWIVLVLLAWLALSAVLAVVVARVIRAGDRHELPSQTDHDDDEADRSA